MEELSSADQCCDGIPAKRTNERVLSADEDCDCEGDGDGDGAEGTPRNSCRLDSISPISVVDEQQHSQHQQHEVDDIKPFAVADNLTGCGEGMMRSYHGGQSHRLAVGFHPGYCHGKTKSPFLLPAEIYKSLFASAVLQQKHQQQQQHLQQHDAEDEKNAVAHFPRNLLFSCPDVTKRMDNSSPSNELETSKPSNFGWPSDNNILGSAAPSPSALDNHLTSAASQQHHTSGHHPNGSAQDQGLTPKSHLSSTDGVGPPPPPSPSAPSHLGINSPPNNNRITPSSSNSMPIGGVQGQNPTQGLVHWMSAVMAEHMTGQTHHDPTAAVGMHYMWNGNVDQCGQHSKEIDYNGWPTPRNHMSMKQGYEAKMNDHHGNLQKGHIFDDGRLDHHAGAAQGNQMTIYGPGGPVRTASSNSNSPGGGVGGGNHVHHSAATSALLVVPQPINATKISASLGPGPGGTGRKYQCKMCPQIFSSKADLQLHTQIHMREAKPYKCSQCAKAFANSSYLSQHTRIHLGIKPYRCEICQRKFTQLSHLQQHIRTHTGDKPYKCRHPGCQKAFSQLSNLQSHSRCHQTDKPYKCNSCYKCFSDEPSLLEHIPKHKESKHLKTHICQYCGKSYTQETYLTKHMQKHAERTDKRPPITGGPSSTTAASNGPAGAGSGGSGTSGGGGTGGATATHAANMNRNLGLNPASLPPVSVGDHPYWPKVSPDSAANLSDVMHHHQHQHHQQQTQQTQPSHLDQFPPINTHQPPQANGHSDLQAHHRMTENGREDIVSTPSTVGPYDTASITKTTSNSAFTPINSMTPHLNTLSHHPMTQRPYLYDAISFQNKNVNQNNANSFPNQLISLHQIRNYAHQPTGIMAGEHLIGVSVGAGKDKG